MRYLDAGFESVVLISSDRTTVRKIYVPFHSSTRWLAKYLRNFYACPTWQNPIAYHEHQILKHLEKYDVAPASTLNAHSIDTKYAGNPIKSNQYIPRDILVNEGLRLFKGLQSAGIQHNDIRDENILFDGSKLTLIDFSVSDTPWLSISQSIPDLSWGRFGSNDRLLTLAAKDLH